MLETRAGIGRRPAAWLGRPMAQQPAWPDPAVLQAVCDQVATLPPLVVPQESDALRDRLAAVSRGEAFLLQGGDCAETFAGTTDASLRGRFTTILQMAVVLTYGASVPVVKVGRIAGQFAKPRSADTETVDGVVLPAYRGDAVNGLAADRAVRTPDPTRLLRAYHTSASALNLLRALASGGEADLRRVHAWTTDFVRSSPAGRRYDAVASAIDRALAFMAACGVDLDRLGLAHAVDFWVSHEALLLPYEEALTRPGPDGTRYDSSAHLLWVGERTRRLDGAHVAFLAGLANPVGVKVGPSASPEEVVALAEALDPDRVPGRLVLISRMGAERVRTALPPLVGALAATGRTPVWSCDPMHGNTYAGPDGRKVRHFDDIMAEVRGFFEVHRAAGTWPGGLHVELTGDDVTECVGAGLEEADLVTRYETACDPRLNNGQSLELAFLVAEMLAAG